MLNRKEVEALKRMVKPGDRIKLIHMDDVHAIPDGSICRVKEIDDAGDIFVEGYGVSILPDVDIWRTVDQVKKERRAEEGFSFFFCLKKIK